MLFTNYQFYIDEFVRLGHEAMAAAATAADYDAFVEPGNVIERAGRARRRSRATTSARRRRACRRCRPTT